MATAWAIPKLIIGARTSEEPFWTPTRLRLLDALGLVAAAIAVVLVGFGAAAIVDASEKVARIDAITTGIQSEITGAEQATARHDAATALRRASIEALDRQLADREGISP